MVRLQRAAAVVLIGMGSVAMSAQTLTGVDEGADVWVTMKDGAEHEGSVAAIAPAELWLDAERGAIALELEDIRRIEGGDSLGNGMRNGAIAGAAALGGFAAFLSHALCEISDGCFLHDSGRILALAGMGAGAGLAAGALIDRVIPGRRTLYASPGAPAVRFTPALAPTGLGVSVSLSWRP